jgi:hypothetical protein
MKKLILTLVFVLSQLMPLLPNGSPVTHNRV